MSYAIKTLLSLLILWQGAWVYAQAITLPDFTQLVTQVEPVVVNVSVTQRYVNSDRNGKGSSDALEKFLPPYDEASPLGDLLRRFDLDKEKGPSQEDASSLGSGIIIRDNGYILTNYHVIKNADDVVVRLNDHRELRAKVVGGDEYSDIGLIKVEVNHLPVAKIGNSETLKVGEWVLAIGSPFGFDHSVTAGIVSAKGRSLPDENYVPYIQSDVAINPGNSGGPLLNLQGEVIGINSEIFSQTGGYMGLSFAVPIELAMEVAQSLIQKGEVRYGWLGVHVQDVTRELAESFGMTQPEGALVAEIQAKSPAAKAGIQPGDIIVEFDHKHVDRSSMLPTLVGWTPIDKEVSVSIIRQGKPLSVRVIVGELPAKQQISKMPDIKENKIEANPWLGISVTNLTAEQRKRYHLTPADGGVLVQKVTSDPAIRAGLRQGDVILQWDRTTVKSVEALNEMTAKMKKGTSHRPIPLLIQRDEGSLWLALNPQDKDTPGVP